MADQPLPDLIYSYASKRAEELMEKASSEELSDSELYFLMLFAMWDEVRRVKLELNDINNKMKKCENNLMFMKSEVKRLREKNDNIRRELSVVRGMATLSLVRR